MNEMQAMLLTSDQGKTFDYIGQANQTKSDKFYGERVPLALFDELCNTLISAGNRLDDVKKALFYGRPIDNAAGYDFGNTVGHIVNWRTKDGAAIPQTVSVDVLHCILGKVTESIELLELLDKSRSTGVFDRVNFQEEIGDGQWYDAIGVDAVSKIPPTYNSVGYPFEEIQRQNIAKLRFRFKDKFKEYDANNRRLDEERRTLQEHEMHGQEPLSDVHVIGSTELAKALDKSEPVA